MFSPQNNNLTSMDVIILCGGEGTRLKGLIKDRPKSMAEFNGRPFLDILLDYFSGFNFKRFILCSGYMSDFIENYYNEKKLPYRIIFSREDKILGTGGALKKAEQFIESQNFLVINGDSFCPVDLTEFVKFHFAKKAMLSIVVVETEKTEDFGSIVMDNFYRIVSFKEKVSEGKAYINAGIYIFDKKNLSLIPYDKKYSLEYELFPQLAGREFYGYITGKKLIDIGTPDRYKVAEKVFPGFALRDFDI